MVEAVKVSRDWMSKYRTVRLVVLESGQLVSGLRWAILVVLRSDGSKEVVFAYSTHVYTHDNKTTSVDCTTQTQI